MLDYFQIAKEKVFLITHDSHCMLLAGISWLKQRFPIKDFGNDETLNILIFYIFLKWL